MVTASNGRGITLMVVGSFVVFDLFFLVLKTRVAVGGDKLWVNWNDQGQNHKAAEGLLYTEQNMYRSEQTMMIIPEQYPQ